MPPAHWLIHRHVAVTSPADIFPLPSTSPPTRGGARPTQRWRRPARAFGAGACLLARYVLALAGMDAWLSAAGDEEMRCRVAPAAAGCSRAWARVCCGASEWGWDWIVLEARVTFASWASAANATTRRARSCPCSGDIWNSEFFWTSIWVLIGFWSSGLFFFLSCLDHFIQIWPNLSINCSLRLATGAMRYI